MRTTKFVCDSPRLTAVLVAFAVAFVGTAAEMRAQNTGNFQHKWLNVGSFHHYYGAGGAEPVSNFDGFTGSEWPGLSGTRKHNVMKGFWVAAKNFTDERGEFFPHKVTHVGPRGLGEGQHFPVSYKMVSKYEPPVVTVDGLETFQKFAFVDEVDPNIPADRMIDMTFNTQSGITVRKRVHAFSQQYHDNYHIIEHTLTNTGNVDDDPEIELPDQTLEGVYASFIDAYYINNQSNQHVPGGAAWGKNTMNDVVGDGMEDYDVDFTALYSWHGYEPSFTEYNNLGVSIIRDGPSRTEEGDTLGRLGASEFIGKVSIAGDVPADGTPQPSLTAYIDQDDRITTNPDAFNEEQMAVEYEFMSQGHQYPHHADVVEAPVEGLTWAERFARATNDPSQGRPGGWKNAHGYGPYELAPGESFHFVDAEAVNGLSQAADLAIGRAYKLSGFDDDQEISFDADGNGVIEDDERMTKNLWVMTSRDSLFMTFERAIANYESGFAIPQPPAPPREFHVSSGPNSIALSWVPSGDAPPAGGYEIWRATGRLSAPYELLASLPASATSYEDATAIRGINYFYYLQAVGEVNQDPTGHTPTGAPLKSGRYYTQTYDPAFLKRPPGNSLESFRIVPNPYNLGSDQNIRWPDQQDRVGFLDIPAQCTIRIYTELGELVETIEHTDLSGDAYWDLTTSSKQIVVSGMYVVVLEDHETNERIMRTMVIIR